MLVALALLVSPASAGTCDAQLGQLGSLSAEAVPGAYGALISCDAKVAETNFTRYLEKATDSDALVGLVMAAIDGDVWTPAWSALSKVASYDARDEVARRVGESCNDHPKVTTFLQGSYAGLRNIDFLQWDDAFAACTNEKLWAWMDGKIQDPPAKAFDEKYGSLMGIYVKAKHMGALPALTAAAIKAGTGEGPFDDILQSMSVSAQTELGSAVDPAVQDQVVAAMVSVAGKVSVEHARGVASALANSGAEGPAASLLPTLYPDRVQADGGFLYAAGSIESGTCSGKKMAFLHYATATEPGKRWSILGDLEAPMRAVKPKLKDCEVESPWPVIHSPEPLASAGEAEAWATAQLKELTDKGYDAKVQKEKTVALP